MSRGALASEFLQHVGEAYVPSRWTPMKTSFDSTDSTQQLGEDNKKSDELIASGLDGVDKDIKKARVRDEDLIGQAFGHKVIKNGLPSVDTRQNDQIPWTEYLSMSTKYPGGDVMHQSMWQKWRSYNLTKTGVDVPPEEQWYSGARLGEYARPLIMGEGKVGYLNQAPVPMSQSEDLLTLMAEAGVASRRARHAALYSRASAGQAEEFFRLAQRRARQVLRDPPLSVRPGGDVYPFYSASMPAELALVAPARCRRQRHRPKDTAQLRSSKMKNRADKVRRHSVRQLEDFL